MYRHWKKATFSQECVVFAPHLIDQILNAASEDKKVFSEKALNSQLTSSPSNNTETQIIPNKAGTTSDSAKEIQGISSQLQNLDWNDATETRKPYPWAKPKPLAKPTTGKGGKERQRKASQDEDDKEEEDVDDADDDGADDGGSGEMGEVRSHFIKDPDFLHEPNTWMPTVCRSFWNGYGDTPFDLWKEGGSGRGFGGGSTRFGDETDEKPRVMSKHGNAVYALLDGQLPLPDPQCVKLYLSSNTADMKAERDAVSKTVFKKMRELCKNENMDFQLVDLRSGPGAEQFEMVYDTADIIEHCKLTSKRVNFLGLIGERLGPTRIPKKLNKEQFERINAVAEGEAKTLLQKWYKLDTNCSKHEYVLMDWENASVEDLQQLHDSLLLILRNITTSSSDSKDAQIEKADPILVEEINQALQEPPEEEDDEDDSFGFYNFGNQEDKPKHSLITGMRNWSNKEALLDDSSAFRQHLDGTTDMQNFTEDKRASAELVKLKNMIKEKSSSRSIVKVRQHYSYRGNDEPKTKLGNAKDFAFEETAPWVAGGFDADKNLSQMQYLEKFQQQCKTYLVKLFESKQESTRYGYDYSSNSATESAIIDTRALRYYTHVDGHTDDAARLCDYILKTDISGSSSKPVLLQGSEKSNGSVAVANLIKSLRAKSANRFAVVPLFLEHHHQQLSLHYVLQQILNRVMDAFYFQDCGKPDYSGDSTVQLARLIYFLMKKISKRLARMMSLLVIIDSIDQVLPDEETQSLWWLPAELPPNVHVIITTSSTGQQQLRNNDKLHRVTLGPLHPDAITSFADHLLFLENRSLTGTNQRQLLEKGLRSNPLDFLFADLSVWMVKQWYSFTEVKETSFLKTSAECVKAICFAAERKLGHVCVSRALGYLALAKHGLSEVELEDILSCDDLVLKDIYRDSPAPTVARIPTLFLLRLRESLPFLVERTQDNIITLHLCPPLVHETVSSLYCNDVKTNSDLHRNIADCLSATSSIKRTITLGKPEKTLTDADRMNKEYSISTKPKRTNYYSRSDEDEFNIRKLCMVPYHFYLAEVNADPSLRQLITTVYANPTWLFARMSASESIRPLLEDISDILKDGRYKENYLRYLEEFFQWYGENIWGRYPSRRGAYSSARIQKTKFHIEVLGRFRCVKDPWIETLVSNIEEDMQKTSEQDPVLYPLTQVSYPPFGPSKYIRNGPSQLFAPSPDGVHALAQAKEYGVVVWNMHRGEVKAFLQREPVKAENVQWSGNGRILCIIEEIQMTLKQERKVVKTKRKKEIVNERTEERGVYLNAYDSMFGSRKHRLCLPGMKQAGDMAVNTDGTLVAVATSTNQICLVDTVAVKATTIKAHKGAVLQVFVSPCDEYLVSVGQGTQDSPAQIKVWNMTNMECKHVIDLDKKNVIGKGMTQLSQENGSLAIYSKSGEVVSIALETGRVLKRVSGQADKKLPSAFTLSWNGTIAAAITGNGCHVWDLIKGSFTGNVFKDHLSDVKCLILSRAGDVLVGGSGSGAAAVFSVTQMKVMAKFSAHGTAVSAICFSSDGGTFYTTAADHQVKAWTTKYVLQEFSVFLKKRLMPGDPPPLQDNCVAVCVTSDSKYAVTVGQCETPRLWDLKTATLKHEFDEAEMTSRLEPSMFLLHDDSLLVLVYPAIPQGKKEKPGQIFVWQVESGKAVGSQALTFSAATTDSNKKLLYLGYNVGATLMLYRFNPTTMEKELIELHHSADSPYHGLSLQHMLLSQNEDYMLLNFQKGKQALLLTVDMTNKQFLMPSQDAFSGSIPALQKPSEDLGDLGDSDEGIAHLSKKQQRLYLKRKKRRETGYKNKEAAEFNPYGLAFIEMNPKLVVLATISDFGGEKAIVATGRGVILVYDFLEYKVLAHLVRRTRGGMAPISGMKCLGVSRGPPGDNEAPFVYAGTKDGDFYIFNLSQKDHTGGYSMHYTHNGGAQVLSAISREGPSGNAFIFGGEGKEIHICVSDKAKPKQRYYYPSNMTSSIDIHGSVYSLALTPDSSRVVALVDQKVRRHLVILSLNNVDLNKPVEYEEEKEEEFDGGWGTQGGWNEEAVEDEEGSDESGSQKEPTDGANGASGDLADDQSAISQD